MQVTLRSDRPFVAYPKLALPPRVSSPIQTGLLLLRLSFRGKVEKPFGARFSLDQIIGEKCSFGSWILFLEKGAPRRVSVSKGWRKGSSDQGVTKEALGGIFPHRKRKSMRKYVSLEYIV